MGVERLCRPRSASMRDADHGADGGGEQDDRQQHLPAEPGAERGQQLEVAVAHAFLAGDQPEQMVDAPEAQVAGDRADDAASAGPPAAAPRPRGAHRLEQQPEPEQRQRQVVRQQLVVDVDEGQRDQEPREHQRGRSRARRSRISRRRPRTARR